jgi:hypothetical protein
MDMGPAPGSLDIDGSLADALTGLSAQLRYDGTLLDWTARQALTPAVFDIATVVESNAGTPAAASTVTVASSSGASRTGITALIQLTFDIPTGASGSVTPVITLQRVGAGSLDVDVTARVVITLPTLLIPNVP